MFTYLTLNESHYAVTNSNYTKEEETVSFDFESGSLRERIACRAIRAVFSWNRNFARERDRARTSDAFCFLHALRARLFTRFFGGTGISRGAIWSGRRPRSVRPDGLSTSACEHSPTRTEISCSDWDDPEFCSPCRTPKRVSNGIAEPDTFA